jgi:hypothetical protein
MIIATTYRPPRLPIPDFVDNLSNFISTLGDQVNFLCLTGDTNICAIDAEFLPMQNLCKTFDLKQVITVPTHCKRLIDQIYVAESMEVISTGISATIEKQHAQTWVKIASASTSIRNAGTSVRKYAKANWNEINCHLMRMNILSEITAAATVDDAVNQLQCGIFNAIDNFVPLTTIKKRKKKLVVIWKAD